MKTSYSRVKRYLSLFKMAEEIFSGLQSNTKCQKLLDCVLTGNSKLYLGKVYTEEQLTKLSKKKVEKLFNDYKAKLSGQMVKLLCKSIINMYSMAACSALGITNQEALSKDLGNDPFLNSALQRFTCELYYGFGSFFAPLGIGIITSRHYLSVRNRNGERMSGTGDNKNGGGETIKMEEMRKQPSKSEVTGSFIGMGMVGFCFGIGLMLAVKTVNNLESCIKRKRL